MNGNIDQHLKIVDDTTVKAKGWLDFAPNDPASVEVWAGVGQGNRNASPANGAVYGDGWRVVKPPQDPKTAAVTQTVIWEFNVKIKTGQAHTSPASPTEAPSSSPPRP
jgi:hypothetical protein